MSAYKLPKLNYELGALEPVISRKIMDLHYNKHHKTYVDNLNKALSSYDIEGSNEDLVDLLKSISDLPKDIQTAVLNNGGGHYNHALYWKTMSPNPVLFDDIDSNLKDSIVSKYGGYQEFVEQFSERSKNLFGSGWVWLDRNLDIVATPNQNNPLTEGGEEPVFGIDVWEHAYYLDYLNIRADYIKAWWSVVDWKFISDRYDQVFSKN